MKSSCCNYWITYCIDLKKSDNIKTKIVFITQLHHKILLYRSNYKNPHIIWNNSLNFTNYVGERSTNILQYVYYNIMPENALLKLCQICHWSFFQLPDYIYYIRIFESCNFRTKKTYENTSFFVYQSFRCRTFLSFKFFAPLLRPKALALLA